MAGPFTLDYFIFVFIASLGVLQIVAAHATLRGLLFVRVRPVAFLIGLVITTLAFLWFFLSEPRNISEAEGGLDGNQMAGFFAVAAGSALLITLLASSLVSWSMRGNGPQSTSGLDALRETTYVKALLGTLKDIWKRY